jgi:carboxymethylenebutenolidase
MTNTLRLTSGADSFVFDAAHFQPKEARRGGLVLVQEIFGVTDHIRELAQTYADDGYEVLAPSLFDRRAPSFQAGYDEDGIARGRRLSEATPWNEVESDLCACVAALSGPVFVVGYCWGGTAAWLAAARVPDVAAVSAYYGRRIPALIDEAPMCPIILHFGRSDPTIPPETIAAIRERYPDLGVHEYDAGHGFASDRRKDFVEDAARLARLRTLQLFHRNAGLSGDGGEP